MRIIAANANPRKNGPPVELLEPALEAPPERSAGTVSRRVESRFDGLLRSELPLLDRDVSDLPTVRKVGEILYGK